MPKVVLGNGPLRSLWHDGIIPGDATGIKLRITPTKCYLQVFKQDKCDIAGEFGTDILPEFFREGVVGPAVHTIIIDIELDRPVNITVESYGLEGTITDELRNLIIKGMRSAESEGTGKTEGSGGHSDTGVQE